MSPTPNLPTIAALEQFARDAAHRGCRVNHQGGGTCLDRQASAALARTTGEQPEAGPRWGSEGETGAWRDRVADGHGLCRGCRAAHALDGRYFEPSKDGYCA